MKFKSTLKYILKLLCCICLMLVPTFMLTACGGTKDPGNPPSNPSSGNESGGDGGNDVELDENGNLPEGTDLNTGKFSDFFKGYSILTNADSSLKLYDPTKLNLGGLGGLGGVGGLPNLDVTSDLFKTEFSQLVDRQIDVLAQDLLYRLAYVYGSNESGVTNRSTTFDSESNKAEANLHNLKLPDGVTDYKYGSNTASISNKAVVTNYNGEVLKTDSFKTIDIDDSSVLSELAKSLLIIETDSTQNYLQRKNALNFVGAISGFNMKITEDLDAKYLDKNLDMVWKITSDPSYTSSTLDGILTVKNSLKLRIAQMLTKDFDSDYSDLIEKINTLGYPKTQKFKNDLINYIYTDIIGTYDDNGVDVLLVDKDNEFAKYFVDNYSGVIDGTSIVAVNNNTSLADDSKDFDSTNNPRLYKGYSIVIPAIVEQALKNTFNGTETSLYPYFSRVDMNYVDFSLIDDNSESDYYSNFASINKVILQPIQSTTVLSGMELNLDTALKDSTDEIIVDVKVGVEYVSNDHKYIKTNDELTPSKNKILFTPSTTLTIDSRGEQTYTIDQTKDGFQASKALPGLPDSKELDYAYIENGGFYKPNEGLNQYHTFTYEFFERDAEVTPFGNYDDGASSVGLTSRDMFTNVFDCEEGSDSVTYQAGENYVQLTFDIVSAKKVTGEAITDFDNILFSFSIIPLLP